MYIVSNSYVKQDTYFGGENQFKAILSSSNYTCNCPQIDCIQSIPINDVCFYFKKVRYTPQAPVFIVVYIPFIHLLLVKNRNVYGNRYVKNL